MKAFRDTKDRTWLVEVNVESIRKVRSALAIDLNKALDDKFQLLSEIVGDPVKLVDVVYCLCMEQARQANVTDEEFGRSMSGDAIMAAADAFIEAVTDFFPNARARAMLAALVRKGRKVQELLTERAELLIEAIDPAKEALTLTGSSGSSPGSSA